MPLPIAHGMMGACVLAAFPPDAGADRGLEGEWRLLLLGTLLGILPDFDYLLTWCRWMGRGWHHDFTHSILFTALMGAAAALLTRRHSWRARGVFWLASLSHPLLDYVYTESRGVELFWPFSNRRYRLGVAPPLGYDWRKDSLPDMALDIATLCAFELAVGASLLMLILMIREALVRARPADQGMG
ncbi:MAG: metal-dependent hydrolase [Blastocatellia bacterium]